MLRVVVLGQMHSGRTKDVHSCFLRDLGKLEHVAPRIAGHGVDHRTAACRVEFGELLHPVLHRLQLEVGVVHRRHTGVNDEVLVGVADTEILGFNVAQHGANHDETSCFRLAAQPSASSTAWCCGISSTAP